MFNMTRRIVLREERIIKAISGSSDKSSQILNFQKNGTEIIKKNKG